MCILSRARNIYRSMQSRTHSFLPNPCMLYPLFTNKQIPYQKVLYWDYVLGVIDGNLIMCTSIHSKREWSFYIVHTKISWAMANSSPVYLWSWDPGRERVCHVPSCFDGTEILTSADESGCCLWVNWLCMNHNPTYNMTNYFKAKGHLSFIMHQYLGPLGTNSYMQGRIQDLVNHKVNFSPSCLWCPFAVYIGLGIMPTTKGVPSLPVGSGAGVLPAVCAFVRLLVTMGKGWCQAPSFSPSHVGLPSFHRMDNFMRK